MASTGDPFLDRLRELQPDVDVVVLPPTVPGDQPIADEQTVEAAATGTAATAADLLAAAGLAPTRTWDRWQRTPEGLHTHRTRVRVERDDEEGAGAAFAAVGAVLVDRAWSIRAIASPDPWLKADAGPVHLDLAVERRQLVLTVESGPLRLPGRPT